MVFHSPGEDRRTIELFGDAAEIRVERVARRFVAQQLPAVFGGEDEVDVNGGKGLWHVGRMVRRVVVCQSQRDCVLQPRVGAPAPTLDARLEPETTPTALRPTAQRCGNAATLGYESNESNNLNEVAAVCARAAETELAATALRLRYLLDGDPG